MILPGKGALPGRPIRTGAVLLGYQRLPACNSSEKSPLRIAAVATAAASGVARRSRRDSKFTSQNVRSFLMGPEPTPPYWFRRSLFFVCVGGRKKLRRNQYGGVGSDPIK